eukprot:gene9293-1381_t
MNIKDVDNFYAYEEENDEDEEEYENELLKQYMVKEKSEETKSKITLTNTNEPKKKTRLKKEKRKENKIQFEESTIKVIKKEEVQFREEVNFQPKIEEYINMNFQRKTNIRGYKMVKNPENDKRRSEIMFNSRFSSNKFLAPEATALKNNPFKVLDVNGEVIPPFNFEEVKQTSHFSMRSNYASVTYNEKIFIHGGTNMNQIYNDLISYNPNENTFIIHSNLTYKKNCSPTQGVYNHQMVCLRNMFMVVYSSGNMLNFNLISGIDNDQTLTWGHLIGLNPTGNVQHISPVMEYQKNQMIKARDSFSLTTDGESVYLFGGKKGYELFDDLIEVKMDIYKKLLTIKVNTIPQENIINWPRKRFGHASEMIYEKMYIFGGRDFQTFFNDLFVYDIENLTWTEIKYTGFPTPVSFSASVYLSNINAMLLYGGLSKDGIEDSLMKFDFKTNEWNLMKVLGQNPNEKSSNYELQLPFHSAKAGIIKNQMYLIGGSIQDKVLNHVLSLNEINEIGRPFMLSKFLNEKRKENFLCDFSIKVFNEENQKFDEINAHKVVISARSPNLLVFENFKDYNYHTILAYIEFLYTGSLTISSKKNIEKICELTLDLGENEEIIKKICYSNVYLSDAQNITDEMETDFGDFLDNEDSSDLTLILGENLKIFVHKVILCRSPYFNKMFTSGMIESSSKEIELLECDKASTLEVLNYLYTDSIELNHENGVGILIVSLLLQIVEISDFCRKIVSNYFSLENIYQILNIADFYSDKLSRN